MNSHTEHNVRTIDQVNWFMYLLAQNFSPQKKREIAKKKVIKFCPTASNDVHMHIREQTSMDVKKKLLTIGKMIKYKVYEQQ